MEQTRSNICGVAFHCVDGFTGGEHLHSVLEKRIIFVVGKGGVGKSTMTAALGLTAAKQGKQVLLVEVGDADHIGPLFVDEPLPETPRRLQDTIWGVRINPKAVIDDYVQTHVPFGFLAGTLTKSSLFDHLTAATPGLKEVMTLGQIWRWEQGQTGDGVPGFDLIIVDAPATGHGLSLLRVPGTLLKMIQVGPIANQTRTVLETLQDPAKTGIVQVTLAEELPVKEALEFETSTRDELEMAHDMIFINTIFPDIFDPEEQAIIQELACRPKNEWPDEVSTMLDFAQWEISRRTLQQTYIDKLIRTTGSSLVGIPYYFTSDLGLVEIGEIADLLMGLMEMSHEQEFDYA